MKLQQPMVPRGNPIGPTKMVEHTTYRPYMQAELVNLLNQFHQWPGEPLVIWLLCLWNLEVESIMCTDNEMEKLASTMTHLSLRQQLQNSWWHRRGKGLHSLLEWVMAAVHTSLGGYRRCVRHYEKMAVHCRLSTNLMGFGHVPVYVQSQYSGP